VSELQRAVDGTGLVGSRGRLGAARASLAVALLVYMSAPTSAQAQAQAPMEVQPNAQAPVEAQTPGEAQAPLQASPAPAAEPVEIHAFVSQGFLVSTDHNYLGPSKRGSFEFTEAGINFTHAWRDNLRIGVQLFVHDLGPLGNYKPQFDWYYIDYRFWDWLGIRAGRTKLPFGLYNEVNDIDAARVPILLPQSVYPVQNREFLLAQTGVELYGYVPLRAAGALEYRVYGGTIFLDPDNTSSEFSNFTVPYMMGARLMWLPPIEGLEVGGSVQRLRLDLDVVPSEQRRAQLEMDGLLPADYDGTISVRIPAWIWVASVQYQLQDLLLATEFTQAYVDIENSTLAPTVHDENLGFYAMGSYRVAEWFTPGLYYSLYEPGRKSRTGPSSYQHDLAASLRFDINPHWLVKAEAHYLHGLAYLDPALNGRAEVTELNGLQTDWGVFLLKTTAYY
jgi:hypothetical protein